MDNGGIRQVGVVTRAASFSQQRLWFLEQLRPGSSDYLLPLALRIRGTLNRGALSHALAAIVDRHEVLRTRYEARDGVPVQRIEEHVDVTINLVDLGVDAAYREHAVTEFLTDELRRPIALTAAPPWRLTLARLAPDDHLLALVVHHIAFDGWSWRVLNRELTAGYAAHTSGVPADLPALPTQYADFAEWQRERVTGPRVTRQLDHWRTRLAGLPSLELPTDRPRPPVWDGVGDGMSLDLSPALVTEVDRTARTHRATRFMVLVAVVQELLGRYSGQADFGLGIPVAGRGRTDVEGLVGFFVNTVVLRADLTGRPTFTELLRRVRQNALAAFSNAEVPFQRVVDEVVLERDQSRNPLFQVSFSLRSALPEPFALPGLDVELVRAPIVSSPFDLNFELSPLSDGGLVVRVQYATALFDRATVRRLTDSYLRLLRLVLARPDTPLAALPLLSQPELRQLEVWNDTRVDYPPGETLPGLVARRTAATPNATAVVSDDGELTYAALQARADRIAQRLRGHGVGPESVVGVCLHRGLNLVVALLGVLRAGGAYLPLAPEDPPERLATMLGDSAASVVLTSADLADRVTGHAAAVLDVCDPGTDGGPTRPREVALDPDHPAYLIYTSGSTGRPKGVVVTHRAILNRLRWMQDTYRIDASDRVLQKTPATFDVSVWEFFWPLFTGATLVLARPGGHRDPEYLATLITAERITTVHFVPAMLRSFLTALPAGPSGLNTLRRVFCSGEALPDDLAEDFHTRIGVELHNLYGPTEAAVDVTATPCRPGERVTIGRPVSNTRVHILDAELRPVPVGATGQLCLAGVQLARGYHARPALTAERFVPDPAGAPGGRLYLTGDLARHRPDGTVEYLGRSDEQAKIRGFRIEPGEIAATLTAHPAVREAAVVVHGDTDAHLVAYLVPRGENSSLDADDLRTHAARLLPAHMVPAYYVALPMIPTTSSGKVDRRALPDPVVHRLGSTAGAIAPRTAVEQTVADVWQEVLGRDRIGVHENFFDVGGHSLLATRIAVRLRTSLGVDVPVRALFEHPSVAALAAALTDYPPLPAQGVMPKLTPRWQGTLS